MALPRWIGAGDVNGFLALDNVTQLVVLSGLLERGFRRGADPAKIEALVMTVRRSP